MKKNTPMYAVFFFVLIFLMLPFSACTKKTEMRKAAEQNDILLGTAVNPRRFKDEKYYETLAQNFNVVTPENVMKWETIHPSRDKYSFNRADKIVDFAKKHKMKVRGHTLTWHYQNPVWLNSKIWSREELLDVLEDHIKTVVGHYKGKVYAWDVVNEPLDGSDYRTTVWSHYIGPEYIEHAFRWAHEADPDALLYLNDYSNGEINEKSNRMYEIVKELLEKDVPIHGVGLQLHLSPQYSFDFESLYMNVHRFTELGLKVDFTEIDIRLKSPTDESDLKKQAQWYSKLMEVMLALPDCNAFTVWGLSDKDSWIPQNYPGYGESLLFEEELEPKPAYSALRETLQEGPKELPYSKNYEDKFKNRRTIPPFKAIAVDSAPAIDGDPDDPQWEKGVTYPFAFNQLDTQDLRGPDPEDLQGTWTVVYKGNKIYGRIQRRDDETMTTANFDYECDNIEVFFELNDTFAQLRSIVGNDWQSHKYEGEREIAWSSDGTVCEYMVTLPDDDLTGLQAGWNISLSDNDGKDVRDHQLYPINGLNQGWKGKELGTIKFVGDSPRVPEKARTVVPFMSPEPMNTTPEIDGNFSADEWEGTVYYPLAYNQLSSGDQTITDREDIHAEWGLLRKGNTLYGFVHRTDDVTVNDGNDPEENDAVILTFEDENGDAAQMSAVVGKDFQDSPFSGEHTAVWSGDGSLVEFRITLPEAIMSNTIIGFNIAVTDVDNGELKHKLYPITGSDKDGTEQLAELQIIN